VHGVAGAKVARIGPRTRAGLVGAQWVLGRHPHLRTVDAEAGARTVGHCAHDSRRDEPRYGVVVGLDEIANLEGFDRYAVASWHQTRVPGAK